MDSKDAYLGFRIFYSLFLCAFGGSLMWLTGFIRKTQVSRVFTAHTVATANMEPYSEKPVDGLILTLSEPSPYC